MGYTHYFHNTGEELNKSKFQDLTKQIKLIANIATHQGIFMQYDLDDDKGMLIRDDEVHFNGIGEEGHETFVLEQVGFNDFCKTARKPYDVAVVACLIALKLEFGQEVEVRSDGDNSDWRDGKKLFELATGIEPKVKIVKQDKRANLLVIENK